MKKNTSKKKRVLLKASNDMSLLVSTFKFWSLYFLLPLVDVGNQYKQKQTKNNNNNIENNIGGIQYSGFMVLRTLHSIQCINLINFESGDWTSFTSCAEYCNRIPRIEFFRFIQRNWNNFIHNSFCWCVFIAHCS